MCRNISLIVCAAVSLVILGSTMVACGGGGEGKATPAAATASTPASGATSATPTTEADAGFDCPSQWTKYACPTISANKGALTVPYRAGVEAEMMCQNVGFYTSGVINGPSILFKLPPGTEIVSPTNGSVLSVSSAPAPHEYTKSVAITGMPFIIYVYFIGDVKVAANAPLVRGDVIGVSTGTFPTDSPPDSKLNGASVLINLLGYDSRMIDASSSDVWAGGVPTCYAP